MCSYFIDFCLPPVHLFLPAPVLMIVSRVYNFEWRFSHFCLLPGAWWQWPGHGGNSHKVAWIRSRVLASLIQTELGLGKLMFGKLASKYGILATESATTKPLGWSG